MQDRIAIAGIKSNSIGIALPLLSVAEREVVADQVIVGPIGKVNAMRAVVIRSVSIDGGIGGAVDVNTRTSGTRHRAAGGADMVVRDRDVVRAEHINPIVHRARDGETIDNNVASSCHPKGTTGG